MSKSEKMRYFRSTPSPFSLTDYATRLELIMEGQPDGVALDTLKDLIQRERPILFEMTARFVPMGTTAEMVAFLQAFIAEEKNGKHIISEEGENAVEKIANAFLERGSELIQTKAYLDAAGTQISNQPISQDIFESLLQLPNGYYNGRLKEDRYFDNKWEEVILILKNGDLLRS